VCVRESREEKTLEPVAGQGCLSPSTLAVISPLLSNKALVPNILLYSYNGGDILKRKTIENKNDK
jgi:hypothetical protein